MFQIAGRAALLLAISAPSAFALEVVKTVDIAAPPAKVWAAIGDFCGISQWHPAITACVPSTKGAAQVRTLTLKGGGTIVEQQTARDDAAMTYSYEILDGPLPVADYKSTITVAPHGDGSIVTWFGQFAAKGAPDSKAEAAIAGVYQSGLAGLSSKVK